MRPGRWKFLVIGVPLVLLCVVLSTHAAEGGESLNERATYLFRWVNFVIVLGILYWLFGRVLPSRFRANADAIGSAIGKASTVKAEAERQVREAESKLAHLEKEVAEMRAEAQRESAAEAERIRALAQTDAQKAGIAGRAEIEAAERAARVELKALAAKLAVDGAEALVVKQLTPATQNSLVESFVKSLEGRPN
jgi:F-type H+-transporting ATPase subunit b